MVRVCWLSSVFVSKKSLQIEFSFFFPQDDVNEATDECEREGQPSQNKGVSISVNITFPLWTHHCVDDGPTHHKQAGEDLEDSREEEASSLYEGEELAEEDDEGGQAEDGGKDHKSLYGLQPLFITSPLTAISSIALCAAIPEVITIRSMYSPRISTGGNEENNQICQMQDQCRKQNGQHVGVRLTKKRKLGKLRLSHVLFMTSLWCACLCSSPSVHQVPLRSKLPPNSPQLFSQFLPYAFNKKQRNIKKHYKL